jgi:hypothetical protein
MSQIITPEDVNELTKPTDGEFPINTIQFFLT